EEARQECLEIARIYAESGDADRAKDFIVRAQRMSRSREPSAAPSIPILPRTGSSSAPTPRDPQPLPEVAVSASGDLNLGAISGQPRMEVAPRLTPPIARLAPEPLSNVVPPEHPLIPEPVLDRPVELQTKPSAAPETASLVYEESALARVEQSAPVVVHSPIF